MPIFQSDLLARNKPTLKPSLIGNMLLPVAGAMEVFAETSTGKSVLMFDLAISLAKGEPLFRAYRRDHGRDNKPYWPVNRACRVLYIDAELGPVGCHERLAKFYENRCIGQDIGDNFILHTGDGPPLALHNFGSERGYDNLDNLISEHKPDVVILDPFAQFHALDENNSMIALPLENARRLRYKHNCAIIIVHHESDKELIIEGKRVEKAPSTARSRGHSCIPAYFDTILRLHREGGKDSPYSYFRADWVKVRHAQAPRPSFIFVDFNRMFVQYVTPNTGNYRGVKTDFINRYIAKYPLPDEENLDEVIPIL